MYPPGGVGSARLGGGANSCGRSSGRSSDILSIWLAGAIRTSLYHRRLRRLLAHGLNMKVSSPNCVKERIKDYLPSSGFVGLSSILAPQGPIPVGRSTWWAGIKTGRFPKPVKLGPRTTALKVEDIRKLIETAE